VVIAATAMAAVASESPVSLASPARVMAWGGEADAEAGPKGRSSPDQSTPRMEDVVEDQAEDSRSQERRIRVGVDWEDSDSELMAGEAVVVPDMLPDTTMLFEDDARSSARGESSVVVEQPVLSLVSLNTRTATTVDILRGTLVVLPELPEPSSAARTVRISCGRDPKNTIVLKDSRVSLHHFTVRVRAAPGGRVVLDLLDQSSNGTWVDGHRVGRGKRVILAVGARIVALPAALVGRSGEVGYVLLHDTKGARCNLESLPAQEAAKQEPPPKGLPRDLEQDLRCGICTDVLHRCLTLVPCGHNFCAVCLAKWRRRSTLCPGCRAPVRQAVQNLDVDKVAETFLGAHPEAARTKEELAALDRAACEPESAAHLRWLLRDPVLNGYGSGNASAISQVATPMRNQTRQARPQSGPPARQQLAEPQPQQPQQQPASQQRAAQQRPRSAEVARQPEHRVQSSACVIC